MHTNYLAAGEKAVSSYTYNVLEKDDEGNLIDTHPTTATTYYRQK
ncbi:hypothetical protein [Vibrio sp. SCSIO 43137]|nr:hypothetical protein [Vibrio sp. SCSIO 43137]WCE31061.1 hypothetical protein PK654_07295 [Vibrio sp. SCSIO 43137]